MSFSLKTNEFQNVISRIRSVSSQAMEKSDSDLKHWAQKIILVNFVFNAESIDQLEQNLPETRKWDLFNLVECYKHCKDDELELLKVASIIIFIYLQEAYFRLGVDKEDPAFNRFKDAIHDLKMNEYQTYKTYFDYLNELPYRITKDIYSNSKLNEIRKFLEEKDFSDFNKLIISTEETLKKIEKWEESFDQKQKAVQDLEERLEQNKLTYDFVLLSKGFQQLYDQKKLELKERRDGYSMFGALLVCTPLAVIVAIVIMILSGYEAKLSSLWFLALPITTLILFLFYFTRVGLQHVRSIQSQMMQLELRMALCQFIHNYAEDSEKLHKKNQAGFEKFENIIFSPLVSSDDKIPTTFDGMEQLAKLIGEFRKN